MVVHNARKPATRATGGHSELEAPLLQARAYDFSNEGCLGEGSRETNRIFNVRL